MSRWDKIDATFLRAADDAASARSLFQHAVEMVEIEVFSYCNRLCWFCPNTDGSRIGPNVHMDPALYSSIVGQLASIDYAGIVTYSRYNEPLADRIILSRISEARAALPSARLHTNTNGDYLNAAYLRDLAEAGLNSLNIQVYLKNFERYDDAKIEAKARQIIGKLQANATLTVHRPGEWLEYTLEVDGLSVRLYGRNFDINGTSRGDTVEIARDYRRTSPCLMPFWSVYIDHDGSTVPCCNLRSDIPAHRDAVIARLTPQADLFMAYAGAKLAGWRAHLTNFEEKAGLCRSCRFALEDDTPEARERAAALAVP